MDEPSSVPTSPFARLGVLGLPNLTDQMVAGGLYVLVAETPPARYPLLAASVQSVLQTFTPCTIVVPNEPAGFLQRLGSFIDIHVAELVRSKRLAVFSTQSEFNKKIFQFGIEGFVQELERFEMPQGAYLLFDQADELLSLHDVVMASNQLSALREWCERRNVTVLLVFSRSTEPQIQSLNALMDQMSGLVRLGADKEGLELSFDYWQSGEGAVAARSYRLEPQGRGLYTATVQQTTEPSSEPAARAQEAETPLAAPPTEPEFFFMDPDLGSIARQVNGTWQQVDTLVGMLHATRSSPYAVCILSFDRDTQLRQLAETAHTLRTTLGRYAKIVVREKEASLRYQNEALLLRLGVNLVVNRSVPVSRLPLLLESLSSQVFTRNVEINFEAALASVIPSRLRGYLQPKDFARESAGMLSQGTTLNIPSALIMGYPVHGMSVAAVIAQCGLSRPGDLVTGDNERCYLFLNGCPESVMLSTLDRILGQPANAVLTDVSFHVQRESVVAELETLKLRAENEQLPDYTEFARVALSDNDAEALSAAPAFDDADLATRTVVPLFKSDRSNGMTSADQKSVATGGEAQYNYGDATTTPVFGRQTAPRALRSQITGDTVPAPLGS